MQYSPGLQCDIAKGLRVRGFGFFPFIFSRPFTPGLATSPCSFLAAETLHTFLFPGESTPYEQGGEAGENSLSLHPRGLSSRDSPAWRWQATVPGALPSTPTCGKHHTCGSGCSRYRERGLGSIPQFSTGTDSEGTGSIPQALFGLWATSY